VVIPKNSEDYFLTCSNMHLITKTGLAKICTLHTPVYSDKKTYSFKEHLHFLRLAGLVDLPHLGLAQLEHTCLHLYIILSLLWSGWLGWLTCLTWA
jgi:hypothetical protein